MSLNHLLDINDLSTSEVMTILELAAKIKKTPAEFKQACADMTLGMIFQKRSTRTRVSFEVGMYQLGGHALFLSADDLQLGRGETIADTAAVLSRYLDGIMARTYAHQDVLDLAQYGSIPVINGLTDLLHPCQALSDLLTVREHKGSLKGMKMTYIGDGNNMAHSLINAAVKVGMTISIGCPEGYEPDNDLVAKARTLGEVLISNDPKEAVADSDVVYTDVWASMGQSDEHAQRVKDFTPFQVNAGLMKAAKDSVSFMHCLPVHRGEEATDEVVDADYSIIFDQAENRLHVQKAIICLLMGNL